MSETSHPQRTPASAQRQPKRKHVAAARQPFGRRAVDHPLQMSFRAEGHLLRAYTSPLPRSARKPGLRACPLLLGGHTPPQGGRTTSLRCLRITAKSRARGRGDRGSLPPLPWPLDVPAVPFPAVGFQLLLLARPKLPLWARLPALRQPRRCLLGPRKCSNPTPSLMERVDSRSSPQLWSWSSPVHPASTASALSRDHQQ